MRRRIRRATMGLQAVKKSDTLIANIGNGSGLSTFTVAVNAVTRNTDGSDQTIQSGTDTASIVNTGNVIKYVNLCFEVAARGTVTYPDPQDAGWFEYAVIKEKEKDTTPSPTNLSVKTVGDICTKVFRGDCLWSGCIPVGSVQPVTLDVKIKIPKVFQRMQLGSRLKVLYFFRSTNVTDLRTDSHRVVCSTNYKVYS